MKLTSPSFEEKEMIPKKYTCQGEGIRPALLISDPPADTASFAMIVHDPDAPMEGGFTHWVVWNIDPEMRDMEENAVPAGAVEGKNGTGETGWIGPCPPTGTHRYEFHLYALSSMLDIPVTSMKGDLEKAMEGKILEETMLTGLYKKE